MQAPTRTSPVGQGDTLLHRVLTAVAETEQCDVLDLPPLAAAIDGEALSQLADGRGSVEISFSYHGYRITIEDDGHVDVRPQE